MNNVWFTGDTHFNHENIISFSDRPFDSVGHMNHTLVENWNDIVRPQDTVYHLGDFAFGSNAGGHEKLFKSLHGNKILIRGNHDIRNKSILRLDWGAIFDLITIKLRHKIVLCHYAMKTWDGKQRGSFMLYGHSHGSIGGGDELTMDVGVDCNDYKPVNYEQICEIMDDRTAKTNFLEWEPHVFRE